jgi:Uma2 family endonuclease
MSQVQTVAPAQGLLLDNVDWETYKRFLRLFAERPGYRLTYDRGVLEIMSPRSDHESDSYLLGRFVDTLTDELAIRVRAGRSTTFRRRRKKRGIEPDNSYWIANESKVRGKRIIDLRTDPPPDLAIETDVTHSSLDRMGVYATLGVPEVWRLEGDVMAFQVLQPNGKYAAVAHSAAFPFVTPADLMRFLALSATQDDTTIVGQFRAWVRQQRPGGNLPPQSP